MRGPRNAGFGPPAWRRATARATGGDRPGRTDAACRNAAWAPRAPRGQSPARRGGGPDRRNAALRNRRNVQKEHRLRTRLRSDRRREAVGVGHSKVGGGGVGEAGLAEAPTGVREPKAKITSRHERGEIDRTAASARRRDDAERGASGLVVLAGREGGDVWRGLLCNCRRPGRCYRTSSPATRLREGSPEKLSPPSDPPRARRSRFAPSPPLGRGRALRTSTGCVRVEGTSSRSQRPSRVLCDLIRRDRFARRRSGAFPSVADGFSPRFVDTSCPAPPSPLHSGCSPRSSRLRVQGL